MIMKPFAKTLMLEKIEYYTTHLSLVNSILPVKLKPKEIEVLANFMAFPNTPENERFSSQNRKIVRNKLNISHGGLSNYISTLRDKGFLKGKGTRVEVISTLIPDVANQVYMFKIINVDQ